MGKRSVFSSILFESENKFRGRTYYSSSGGLKKKLQDEFYAPILLGTSDRGVPSVAFSFRLRLQGCCETSWRTKERHSYSFPFRNRNSRDPRNYRLSGKVCGIRGATCDFPGCCPFGSADQQVLKTCSGKGFDTVAEHSVKDMTLTVIEC